MRNTILQFIHLPNVLVGLQLVGTKLLGETAAEHNNLTVSGDTWSFSLVLRRSFEGFLLWTRQNRQTSRNTFQTWQKKETLFIVSNPKILPKFFKKNTFKKIPILYSAQVTVKQWG